MAVGAACAGFLRGLRFVTEARFDHPWLLYLLPAGGLAAGLFYHRRAKPAEAGPMLTTHDFGGSSGREGAAVLVGGSIAGAVRRMLRSRAELARVVLMGGAAAGFGTVFGRPLGGAVFAMEILAIGRIGYSALPPCFVAAVVGDRTCHACGAETRGMQFPNWPALARRRRFSIWKPYCYGYS